MTLDPSFEITSEADLWDWLAGNHAHSQSIWLITFKAADRARYVSRDAVLDALIAYGWIDGRRKVVDAARTAQLIAPRQQQAWSQSYKDRAARLEAEGRMKDPGRAAIELGKRSGLWEFYQDVDALHVPDDLERALQIHGGAIWFHAAAPSYRRNLLRWVKLAKTDTTRSKRIQKIAETAAAGRKIPNI